MDKNILTINVHEKVNLKDVPPGTPPGGKMSKEEAEKRRTEAETAERENKEKIMAEYVRLMGRYVKPHNKKSRWVKEEDIPKVIADGIDMVQMCGYPRGQYQGIAALAHSQVDDQDPLRFFVP